MANDLSGLINRNKDLTRHRFVKRSIFVNVSISFRCCLVNYELWLFRQGNSHEKYFCIRRTNVSCCYGSCARGFTFIFFFFVACAPETVTQRKFFFVSLQIKGCWPFQRTYKSAKLNFLFSPPWSVFIFFFCVETLLKVSEMQGRNDLYQHKMHDDDRKVGRRGLAKFRLLTKTSCWLQLKNNKFIIRNLASRGKTPTLAASFSIITYQGCASRYNFAPRVVLVICRRSSRKPEKLRRIRNLRRTVEL